MVELIFNFAGYVLGSFRNPKFQTPAPHLQQQDYNLLSLLWNSVANLDKEYNKIRLN